ncbi:hypothetical protein Tco_0075739, partial [Tanacetum coccineum]
DITDDTTNVVVVMFDEPETTLVGCSAESIMEDDDEGVAESVSSSTLDAAGASKIPKLKSVTQDPSVPTPSNPLEERPTKRIEIEDSESEDRGDTAMHPVDKKKGILMRKITVVQLSVEPGRKITGTQIRKQSYDTHLMWSRRLMFEKLEADTQAQRMLCP